MMSTTRFEVGELSTNCYVVFCQETNHAVIIDPGFESKTEAEKIFDFIRTSKLQLKYIINTHGHPDHTCGNDIVKKTFNLPICIHQEDACFLGKKGIDMARYFGFNSNLSPADIILQNNQSLQFGKIQLQVIHSPGHSKGSILLLGSAQVFTGDTLFAGSIGRTDFPGSSDSQMQLSLQNIKKIPNNYTVLPGHGPTSTIAQEKQYNPFLNI